jgi:hypothetical protein
MSKKPSVTVYEVYSSWLRYYNSSTRERERGKVGEANRLTAREFGITPKWVKALRAEASNQQDEALLARCNAQMRYSG